MMTKGMRGIKAWALCVPLIATTTLAQSGDDLPRLPTDGASVTLGVIQADGQDEQISAADPALPYGSEGTEWLLVGGGAAYDLSDSTDLNLNVAYSLFLVDDVEWLLELSAWYHAQEGDDAASLNPAMEFRWHFYNEGDTSIFVNAGIGVLGATDNVPFDGSGFNLTPRAGLGVTHRLWADGTRLIAGVRWHHISNARINGEDRNPSRDAPMLYFQVAFPF